jgi:hypothetical protein
MNSLNKIDGCDKLNALIEQMDESEHVFIFSRFNGVGRVGQHEEEAIAFMESVIRAGWSTLKTPRLMIDSITEYDIDNETPDRVRQYFTYSGCNVFSRVTGLIEPWELISILKDAPDFVDYLMPIFKSDCRFRSYLPSGAVKRLFYRAIEGVTDIEVAERSRMYFDSAQEMMEFVLFLVWNPASTLQAPLFRSMYKKDHTPLVRLVLDPDAKKDFYGMFNVIQAGSLQRFLHDYDTDEIFDKPPLDFNGLAEGVDELRATPLDVLFENALMGDYDVKDH